jgi:hypothetical protein
MRGLVVNRTKVEVKNISSKSIGKNFEDPHYAYPNRVATTTKTSVSQQLSCQFL